MTDNEDKNPTTTIENARARTNPKTIKERIKSLARRHIHTGNDRRTPVKLKTAHDPVISALEQHEAHTYPFGKAHPKEPITSSFSAQANPKRA